MDQLGLLNKIITLYSWDPTCLGYICCLAETPGTFAQTIAELEKWVLCSKEDVPLPEADANLPNDECRALYHAIVTSAPLFELFKSEPLFSQSSPADIETLAQLADISPDPETMLRTRDTTFMRVLDSVVGQDAISASNVLQDDITKLVDLRLRYSELAELLYLLAQSNEWKPQVQSIEAVLSTTGSREQDGRAQLVEPARRILEILEGSQTGSSQRSGPRELFLQSPLFSSMLREEVLLLWNIRERLPKAETLLSEQLVDTASPAEKSRRVAVEAMKLLPTEGRRAVESSLNLRIQAARHFLSLRKFAKLDALSYRWPELAYQFRVDRSILKTLEIQAINPQPLPPRMQEIWQLYQRDEQLLKYLRSRPRFHDIAPIEAKEHVAVSQTVAQAPLQGVMEPKEALPKEVAPTYVAPLEEIEATYENLYLGIEETGDPNIFMLTLKGSGFDTLEQHVAWPELAARIQEILPEAGMIGYRSPLFEESRYVQAPSRAIALEILLRQMGTEMYNSIFKNSFEAPLLGALRGENRVRAILETRIQIPEFVTLPWECLYVPALRTSLSLTQKYSFVRYFPDIVSLRRRAFEPPYRLLAVLSSPVDAPPLNVDGEEQILRQALEPAINEKQVELLVLRHEEATLDQLQRALRTFEPHVFHFVGHGMYNLEDKKGVVWLEDVEGRGKIVSADDFRTLISDSNVSLAVLNSCDSGTASTNEVITGVAGALVGAGVPAAIATTRRVPDIAALMFARELYRALVDGYTLEASITEARKALSVEKWDWSVYALFTSSIDSLDSFRLVTPKRGRRTSIGREAALQEENVQTP